MGEQKVTLLSEKGAMQRFVKCLLKDMNALEFMLENDWFETEPIRIGAEQEMFLVDNTTLKPAPISMELIERMSDAHWLDTELARFNLEINSTPQLFEGKCLSELERETDERLQQIRHHLAEMNADVILTGILPTLRKFDLEMHNLTPMVRYKALMEAIDNHLEGKAYELRILGIDELLVKHNSPLLEACNTSFQVHLQVTPAEFVHMYNIAQALAAPTLAVGANSPVVFGKRLWHETRIALFQQSIDIRTTHEHMRERSPRVSFGKHWLENSVLDIYKEDIARFRVLLSANEEEDSIRKVKNGEVPKLKCLQVHNSTVYRWNRPCYGISDTGKPHLRIENRVLPSGPTVIDEIANAAFWLGAMVGMGQTCPDIREYMEWEDVRDNFGKAARFGIESKFNWFDDRRYTAAELIEKELLPLARQGLESRNVDSEDIDKYLGIIEDRVKEHRNGARWQLKAFTKLARETSRDEALSALTAAIKKNQWSNIPGHCWESPELHDLEDYKPSELRVDECMTTDLFTAREGDLIDLVAEMMDWRKIRYMPVEDPDGNLVGLITSRLLLRHFAKRYSINSRRPSLVKDIMVQQPIAISPEASIMEAMATMRDRKIGCLPVVKVGDEKPRELIGIITEMDFLRITSRLLERLERQM